MSPKTDPYDDPDAGKPAEALDAAKVDPHRPLDEQLEEAAAEVGIVPAPNAASETPDDKANRGATSAKPQKKGRPKKEPVPARTFKVADIVGPIAKLLIADHFPELSHLDIRYVFTSRAAEVDKKPVITKSKKLDGLAAWFANGSVDGEANPFFFIEISETHWNSMGRKGKEAFLDDALSNFGTSNKGALKMVRKDIIEHSAVLARHGLYSAELKKSKKAIETALGQPSLEIAS